MGHLLHCLTLQDHRQGGRARYSGLACKRSRQRQSSGAHAFKPRAGHMRLWRGTARLPGLVGFPLIIVIITLTINYSNGSGVR